MKFKITRAKENKFESGLRGFFSYKNLGIEEATKQSVTKTVLQKFMNRENWRIPEPVSGLYDDLQ